MLVDVQLSGSPVVVDDVDDAGLLELIEKSELLGRQAELQKLNLAVAWAERHVVSDVGDAARWSDADRRDVEATIGGEGTPLIAAGSVEQLAVALRVSAPTAMQLVSDGLDVAYRLPRVSARLARLELAPWRARRIAVATHHLSQEAAAYVDQKVAPVADSCGVVRIERLVDEAVARFDPVEQAEAEDEAMAAWGVQLTDYSGPVWAGTSRMEITGSTPILHAFRDLLSANARELLDPDTPTALQPTHGQRMVTALGQLGDASGARTRTTAYLHLTATDLTGLPDSPFQVGTVEKLGPLTVTALRHWLGTSRFTLQPLLDLARTDAVDQHDPPAWMRELVILRDRTCVYPYCTRDSRSCDLDHIEAFVEMDDGGPPRQTRPENLAPLCRRHHRAKTHFGWSYLRNRDGSYTWTGPLGQRLTVDHRGVVLRR